MGSSAFSVCHDGVYAPRQERVVERSALALAESRAADARAFKRTDEASRWGYHEGHRISAPDTFWTEGREGLKDLCRQKKLLPITIAIGFDRELGTLVSVGRLNFESYGQQVKMFDASELVVPDILEGEQMDALRSKAFEIINREDAKLATMIAFQRSERDRLVYRLTQESLLMSLRRLERRTALLDIASEDLAEIALCDSLWLDKMVADAKLQGLREAAIVREAAPGETGDVTLCSRRF
jgi:hypothetical protein